MLIALSRLRLIMDSKTGNLLRILSLNFFPLRGTPFAIITSCIALASPTTTGKKRREIPKENTVLGGTRKVSMTLRISSNSVRAENMEKAEDIESNLNTIDMVNSSLDGPRRIMLKKKIKMTESKEYFMYVKYSLFLQKIMGITVETTKIMRLNRLTIIKERKTIRANHIKRTKGFAFITHHRQIPRTCEM